MLPVNAQLSTKLPDKDRQRVRALLLDAVGTRENEAFGRLFQVFSDDLHRRFSRRLSRFPRLRKKQAVDDMVQETAVCALRGFRRFEGDDPQLFQRWLARISRSVFADAVRHARKKKRDIARERSQIQDLTIGSDPARTSGPTIEEAKKTSGVTVNMKMAIDQVRRDRCQNLLNTRNAAKETVPITKPDVQSHQATCGRQISAFTK